MFQTPASLIYDIITRALPSLTSLLVLGSLSQAKGVEAEENPLNVVRFKNRLDAARRKQAGLLPASGEERGRGREGVEYAKLAGKWKVGVGIRIEEEVVWLAGTSLSI